MQQIQTQLAEILEGMLRSAVASTPRILAGIVLLVLALLVAAAAAKGLGAPNPAQLERFSGLFALDALDPAAGVRLDQPLELKRIGTGLMLIRRAS